MPTKPRKTDTITFSPPSEVDMPRNVKFWVGGLLGVLLVAACGGGAKCHLAGGRRLL